MVPTILWNGTECLFCKNSYLFYGTVTKHALDNYSPYNIIAVLNKDVFSGISFSAQTN